MGRKLKEPRCAISIALPLSIVQALRKAAKDQSKTMTEIISTHLATLAKNQNNNSL